MKQTYLTLMFSVFVFLSHAQIVTIPDANFKNALLNSFTTIDTNGDGEIQYSEAEAITSLTSLSNSQISDLTGIEAFINVETLNISGNPYSSVDLSSNTALVNLNAQNCQLTTLDLTANISLVYCALANNQLISLDVNGLTLLRQLDVQYNQLGAIDLSTNSSLETLYLTENLLTSLDVSQNSSLIGVTADNNQLTSININGATSLNNLYIANNQLTSLDFSYTTPVSYIGAEYNQLTSVDFSGATNLITLNVANNQLTSLDLSSLIDLVTVEVNYNQLTSLDVNSNINLTNLYFGNNLISNLNIDMVPSLTWIQAESNQLTSLDVSGNPNLVKLIINNNQLTSLTGLSDTIRQLDCSYNQFTTLDFSNLTILGNSFSDELLFGNNPNLEYINFKNGNNHNYDWSLVLENFNLDSLAGLQTACVDDVDSYFAEDIQSTTSQDVIFTEYCSFTPGGEYYIVSGNTTLDANSDGCDVSDAAYPNLAIQITNGTLQDVFYSNELGEYSMPIQAGSYTITPQLENPDYYLVSPTSVSIDFPSDNSPYIQDFCVTPNGVHNDLEVVILPLEDARPGFDTDYKIVYRNKGNTTLSGNVDFTFNDDYMNVQSTLPLFDSLASGNLSWNYTNLSPLETREILVTMTLNTPTDATFPLNADDILVFNATINPLVSDETEDDNQFALNQVVVNSYDPNDKTCIEGEFITINEVGKYVHYLIRFENTGTANAINIVVKDDIDTSKYDITSLVPIDASHNYYTRIQNENEVEFIFENIQLPFDDANNDGYVLFKLKTLESLVIGDDFSNDAEIYFDYNAPIITNNETTTVQDNLGLDNLEYLYSVRLFPNAVQNYFSVFMNENLQLEAVKLYDLLGKEVRTFYSDRNNDVSQLNAGIYVVKIITDKGTVVKQLVKK